MPRFKQGDVTVASDRPIWTWEILEVNIDLNSYLLRVLTGDNPDAIGREFYLDFDDHDNANPTHLQGERNPRHFYVEDIGANGELSVKFDNAPDLLVFDSTGKLFPWNNKPVLKKGRKINEFCYLEDVD